MNPFSTVVPERREHTQISGSSVPFEKVFSHQNLKANDDTNDSITKPGPSDPQTQAIH